MYKLNWHNKTLIYKCKCFLHRGSFCLFYDISIEDSNTTPSRQILSTYPEDSNTTPSTQILSTFPEDSNTTPSTQILSTKF